MPRGVRNLSTIKGLDSTIELLKNKKQNLLNEIEKLDREIEELTAKSDELAKGELLNLIIKSGKSVSEVKESLGL